MSLFCVFLFVARDDLRPWQKFNNLDNFAGNRVVFRYIYAPVARQVIIYVACC